MRVARCVTAAPFAAWRAAALELWAVAADGAPAGGRQLAEVLPRGTSAFQTASAAPGDWPRLLDGRFDTVAVTWAAEAPVLELAADLRARWTPPPAAREAVPGLTAVLVSERQPRVITAASGSASLEGLLADLRRLVVDSQALWAGIEDTAGSAGPFGPATRTNAEWREAIATQLPPHGAVTFLGAGHLAALGPPPAGEPLGHGLLVRDAAAAPEIARIVMAPPLDPEPVLLVAPGAAVSVRPGTPDARRLADGTVELAAGTGPRLRGDAVAGARLQDRLRAMYGAVEAIVGAPAAPPLYLPRLLGPRSYLRIGAPGLDVWDTGEPLGDRLPIAVAGDAPDGGLPWPESAGEPLLVHLLELDAWARERRPGTVGGVTLGPVPTAAELERRWTAGEPPLRG